MPNPYPKDADLIAIRGGSWFGRLLAWFQSTPQDRGDASHIALAFLMAPARRNFLMTVMRIEPCCLPETGMCVIEAHFSVRVLSWDKFLAGRKRTGDTVYIIHDTGLSPESANRIVRHALTYAGEPYSVKRLIAMALHLITGKRFDLMMKGDRPVCSYLGAKPYFVETGVEFENATYKECTPDNVIDHARNCHTLFTVQEA